MIQRYKIQKLHHEIFLSLFFFPQSILFNFALIDRFKLFTTTPLIHFEKNSLLQYRTFIINQRPYEIDSEVLEIKQKNQTKRQNII